MTAYAAWPKGDLPQDAIDRIAKARWVRFDAETVVAIALAWEAEMSPAAMARDLECGRQSICMLIGRLRALDVPLRRADRYAAARVERIRSAPAVKLAQEQLDRLRRLAPFDAVAARTLALFEAGQ